MFSRRRVRWLVFGLSCLGVPLVGQWVASTVGSRVGAVMAVGAAALRLGKMRWTGVDWSPPDAAFSEVSFYASAPTEAGAAPVRRAGRGAQAGAANAPPPRGLVVRAATVLRLASSEARPRGVPVDAKGRRPPGILLTNVAALGIGLADGDVLVSVAGAPARDVGGVIARVIAARSRHARVIVGEVWRDGSTFAIAVEQPYLGGNAPN